MENGSIYLGNYNLSEITSVKVYTNKMQKKKSGKYNLGLAFVEGATAETIGETLSSLKTDTSTFIRAGFATTTTNVIQSSVITMTGESATLDISGATIAEVKDDASTKGDPATDADLSISEVAYPDPTCVLGSSDKEGALVLMANANATTIEFKKIEINYTRKTVLPDTFTITATDDEGTIETAEAVGYNSLITVAADAQDADGNAFAYWTKNGMPVSKDTTYSFYAHENADLVAVYADKVDASFQNQDARTLTYVTYDVDEETQTISYYVEYYAKDADSTLRPFVTVWETAPETYSATGAKKIVTDVGSTEFTSLFSAPKAGQYKITFEGYKDGTSTPIAVAARCGVSGDSFADTKTSFTSAVGPNNYKRAAVGRYGSDNAYNGTFKSNE